MEWINVYWGLKAHKTMTAKTKEPKTIQFK